MEAGLRRSRCHAVIVPLLVSLAVCEVDAQDERAAQRLPTPAERSAASERSTLLRTPVLHHSETLAQPSTVASVSPWKSFEVADSRDDLLWRSPARRTGAPTPVPGRLADQRAIGEQPPYGALATPTPASRSTDVATSILVRPNASDKISGELDGVESMPEPPHITLPTPEPAVDHPIDGDDPPTMARRGIKDNRGGKQYQNRSEGQATSRTMPAPSSVVKRTVGESPASAALTLPPATLPTPIVATPPAVAQAQGSVPTTVNRPLDRVLEHGELVLASGIDSILTPIEAGEEEVEDEAGYRAESRLASRVAQAVCDERQQRCKDGLPQIQPVALSRIDIDITPPFTAGETDPDRVAAKRQTRLESAEYRTWHDRQGNRIGQGRVVDLRFGQVKIETQAGAIESLRYRELSDDDACYMATLWDLPMVCRSTPEEYTGRNWELMTFTWTASALCHKPLYFEDVSLERYGHSAGPLRQTLLSGAHFFGNVAILPYNVGLHGPFECRYALGYYRPGSCAPWLLHATSDQCPGHSLPSECRDRALSLYSVTPGCLLVLGESTRSLSPRLCVLFEAGAIGKCRAESRWSTPLCLII